MLFRDAPWLSQTKPIVPRAHMLFFVLQSLTVFACAAPFPTMQEHFLPFCHQGRYAPCARWPTHSGKAAHEIVGGVLHFISLFYNSKACKQINKKIPCNRDAWIQIVELWGAQCNLLVLLSVCGLHLQLHQLLLYPLDSFTLHIHSSECHIKWWNKDKHREKGRFRSRERETEV